ncbi:hypothetical protein ABK040_000583 [Willaertia magna]
MKRFSTFRYKLKSHHSKIENTNSNIPSFSFKLNLFSILLIIFVHISTTIPTFCYSSTYDNKQTTITYSQVSRPWIRANNYVNCTSLSDIYFSTLQVPIYSYTLTAKVNQYSVSLFPSDSPMKNICTSFPFSSMNITSLPFYLINEPVLAQHSDGKYSNKKPKGEDFGGKNLCLQFFCENTTAIEFDVNDWIGNRMVNLSTNYQRESFSMFYNYCFYCESEISLQFKTLLFNQSSVYCPLYDNFILRKAISKCMGKDFTDFKVKSDETTFPAYFYLSWQLMNNDEYYGHEFSFKDLRELWKFHFPFNCYCKGPSFNLGCGLRNYSFGFECDIFTSAIIPIIYEVNPIVLLGLLLFVLLFSFFTLLLPAIYSTLRNVKGFFKKLTFLFDLRIQSNTLLFCSIILMMCQQIISVMFNFYRFSDVYDEETSVGQNGIIQLLGNGLFRIISLVFLCGSFASMLVSWQHMISIPSPTTIIIGANSNNNSSTNQSNQQSNVEQEEATGILSMSVHYLNGLLMKSSHILNSESENNETGTRTPLYSPTNNYNNSPNNNNRVSSYDGNTANGVNTNFHSINTNATEYLSFSNKLILIGFYSSLLSLLIAIIVLSNIIKTVSTIVIVFVACGMIYLWIFPIAFLFSAIRMYYKLKSMKENLSFSKLKFTRFMIFANICFILLIIIGVLYALTFLLGWDLFGITIGILRALIMDLTITLMMVLVNYMLFNKKFVKDFYGDFKEKLLLTCRKLNDNNNTQIVIDFNEEDSSNKVITKKISKKKKKKSKISYSTFDNIDDNNKNVNNENTNLVNISPTSSSIENNSKTINSSFLDDEEIENVTSEEEEEIPFLLKIDDIPRIQSVKNSFKNNSFNPLVSPMREHFIPEDNNNMGSTGSMTNKN